VGRGRRPGITVVLPVLIIDVGGAGAKKNLPRKIMVLNGPLLRLTRKCQTLSLA